jgi:hypothetical protein
LSIIEEVDQIFPQTALGAVHSSNFHATLYCDDAATELVLSFRGSVSPGTVLTSPNQVIEDWLVANVRQHLGVRPLQYQLADKAAALIEKARIAGQFNGACGKTPASLILTGHSKGGGQAQYAAVKNKFTAAVYNSDMVNPIIFVDWLQLNFEPIPDLRRVASIVQCHGGAIGYQLTQYFNSGRITDVRMTNDPLTRVLFKICGNNLPHAPVNWLLNTSTCSADGHAIETVVHEMQVCGGP